MHVLHLGCMGNEGIMSSIMSLKPAGACVHLCLLGNETSLLRKRVLREVLALAGLRCSSYHIYSWRMYGNVASGECVQQHCAAGNCHISAFSAQLFASYKSQHSCIYVGGISRKDVAVYVL